MKSVILKIYCTFIGLSDIVLGCQMKWRDVLLDASETIANNSDPGWRDLVIWSQDTRDEPILTGDPRRILPAISSQEVTHRVGDVPTTGPSISNTNSQILLVSRAKGKSQKYKKNEIMSVMGLAPLWDCVSKILQIMTMKRNFKLKKIEVKKPGKCAACRIVVTLLKTAVSMGGTPSSIAKIAYKFCILKMKRAVCSGIMRNFTGEVIYALTHSKLTSKQICSMHLGEACGDVENPDHEWEVEFPKTTKPNVPEPALPNDVDDTRFKVLHLTDTHFDPLYKEGSNANCDAPLCCRADSGIPKTSYDKAGHWGGWKCDAPKALLDNMFQHITSHHPDVYYIIWTGDVAPHAVWDQSKEEILNAIKETADQMLKAFPGIPIFPALGNHETSPCNSFPTPFVEKNHENYSADWLYAELETQWQNWLPESTSKTIRHGAFYSVLLRPKFRIISLNTNFCNNINWWLLLNSTDPANELQWLVYELHSAELKDEKVHIIGHISPGDEECMRVWSRNYYKIVVRFEATIKAQFFGHTHFDEFKVFYDPDDTKRAINVAYIGPSVTPHTNLNPGYRIYYVDGEREGTTRAVLNHETWVMDLEDANSNFRHNPKWYKMYSVKEAYGMPSLSPQEWDNFINKLIDDDEMFQKYYQHFWQDSPVKEECNFNCKVRLICNLKSGRSHDSKTFCGDIAERVSKAPHNGANLLITGQ